MDKNITVGMHPGASVAHLEATEPFGANADAVGRTLGTSGTSLHPLQTLSSPNPEHAENTLPQRKNIRAEFHNYSGGAYFITICTRDKKHYFGKIVDGIMHYSKIGEYANHMLETLASHYSYVDIPSYVVMPNHIHAIIYIYESDDLHSRMPQLRSALGVVVGGYKQNVTIYARKNDIEFGWQLRYHDHIIRGRYDLNRISEYIETNVLKWANDCYY